MTIDVDQIKERLSEEGYEILPTGDPLVFRVRDLESGLIATSALEENILFNTVACFTLPRERITLELTRRLLDADNGIETSAFQLYSLPGGDESVVLTNFCKLQSLGLPSLERERLGAEDEDDILSCLSFLFVDVLAARTLLTDYA